MGISFADPERLKEIFDGENREEWQKTSYIIEKLQLSSDMIIADVGAGTGYFSNIFSQIVARGKVYSIDCEPNMVSYLKNRFSHKRFAHIDIIQSQMENPCVPNDVDLVFVANTYRFISERHKFLENLYQQIKSRTQLVFVDFKGAHARVTSEMARNEIEQAGFKVLNLDRSGCPDHYILTFEKE